jgi:hypothetical protein
MRRRLQAMLFRCATNTRRLAGSCCGMPPGPMVCHFVFDGISGKVSSRMHIANDNFAATIKNALLAGGNSGQINSSALSSRPNQSTSVASTKSSSRSTTTSGSPSSALPQGLNQPASATSTKSSATSTTTSSSPSSSPSSESCGAVACWAADVPVSLPE